MAKNLEFVTLLDFYGEVLTEKQHDVMQQYYYHDLSLAEIGENFDISRQGVRDSLKRSEAILLELEEKIGFAKRDKVVRTSLANLLALAENINDVNLKFGKNESIKQSANEMLSIIASLSEQ
jgi:predicted DNA-binding protein YlxM (UPF0122 family)